MGIPRSSFYNWKRSLFEPSKRARDFARSVMLFMEYHKRYPSHGYRWLNAKIRLDTGIVHSDPYAYKCCRAAGIKSKAKHYRYKKPGNPYRLFPNLLLAGLPVYSPMQYIASDMTAFCFKGTYYELTLYMDLWNNEIVSHALSSRRGDRMTYIDGLEGLIMNKDKKTEWQTILHTDQGAVYASKKYNDILELNHIAHSMSRSGTPTDNAAMEAINGWLKAELFTYFHVTGKENIEREIEEYIKFFNEERPAYALGYMTPKQYKEAYGGNGSFRSRT